MKNSFLKQYILPSDYQNKVTEECNRERKNIIKGKNSSYPILKILFRLLYKSFLYTALFKLITSFSLYFSLYFLDCITEILKKADRKDNLHLIIIYLGGLVFNNFLNAFTSTQFQWRNERIRIRTKCILRSFLYEKLLKKSNVNNFEDKEDPNEEHNNIDVVNLDTVDIEEINQFFFAIHEIWAAVLEILYCLALFYYKIGNAVFICCYLLFFVSSFNFIISFCTYYLNELIAKAKDERISLTTDIINGIKSIKFLSWERIFKRKLETIRMKEFNNYFKFNLIYSFVDVFWGVFPYLIIFFSLKQYVEDGNNIIDVNIFTIIGLANSLTNPVGLLPWGVVFLVSSRISYKRIFKYLNDPELEILKNNGIPLKDIAMTLKNLTFKFPNKDEQKEDGVEKNSEPLLTNSSFKLHILKLDIVKGSLNFVIGQVGSGKSAFLHSLLGEMHLITNKNDYNHFERELETLQTFQVNGRIAYVSQNNFIQNLTMKENIVFGNEFNPSFYQKCLQLTELNYDVEIFPNKDEHLVGPGGSNLSGGQKQRLAIARAIYQDADIIFFDDSFSSLDINVATKIYKNLVLDYLMKEGKTIIFVTSQYQFIESTKEFFNIIYIENGRIVDHASSKVIINLTREHSSRKVSEDQIDNASYRKSFQREGKHLNLMKIDENTQTNVFEDFKEVGTIKLKTVILYIKSFGYIAFLFFFSNLLLEQASRNFIDFWLKDVVENVVTNFLDVFPYLILINIGFTFFRSVGFAVGTLMASKNIFEIFNTTVMFAKMRFFDKNSFGAIISRYSNDMMGVDQEIPYFFHMFLLQIVRCTFLLGISFSQIPILILSLIPIVCLINYFAVKYRTFNRELRRLHKLNTSYLVNHFTETMMGSQTIRAFNKQTSFIQRFEEYLDWANNTELIIKGSFFWLVIRLLLISVSIILFASVSVILIVIFDIEIDYLSIAMTLSFLLIFIMELNYLIVGLTDTESAFISSERILQYIENAEIEEDHLKEHHELIKTEKDPEYSIIFDKVCLQYDKINHPEKYSLKNISFKLRKGEKVAFCGRTGSGKTSILNILFRLYPISEGKIIINNANIADMDIDQTKKLMSIIPQFGFIFRGSFFENIDPNSTYSSSLLAQKILPYLLKYKSENFTMDSNFMIDDSGKNLSNGQKQLINFLRIVLQDTEIICLDEATSNLDPLTDQQIHEDLFELAKDKTLIVITHRLENIERFDRVFVMERGEIVEEGEAKKLMEKDGFFRKVRSEVC